MVLHAATSMPPQDIEKIIEAALRVKSLRQQLEAAEAELAYVSNATTTRGAPRPATMPPAGSKLSPRQQALPARDRIRALMVDGRRRTSLEVAAGTGLKHAEAGDHLKRMADMKRVGRATFVYKKP